MIRLGGPVYVDDATRNDPEAYVQAHKAKGFRAAYAPLLPLDDLDLIHAFRDTFATADIMIAEVGYWHNMLDLDDETRRANRAGMVDALRLADELHAACAVNVLGMYEHADQPPPHGACNFSEEAFDTAVELARFFIDEVQPEYTTFAYEIYPFNVVDSPEELERLLRAVDREQFAIHLDLVNLVNTPRRYWSSGDVMRDCIRRFGDRIVSSHAKDISMQPRALSVVMTEVVAGEGDLDMAAYIRCLADLPQTVPFMMEHLKSEEEYDRSAAHIRRVAAAEGVALE